MKTQNYKNHRLMEPVQYFVLFPLSILLIVAAVIDWVDYSAGEQGLWETIVHNAIALAIFALGLRARIYALIAQDRAIRAEEQFRHFVLTGKPLPVGLGIAQIVALRFASDGELSTLANAAVNEQLTADQIKQKIQNWKPDHHRV